MIRYEWVWRPSAKALKEIAGLYKAAGWWEPTDTPQRICGMVMGSHCFLAARSGGRLVGMGRAISDRTNDGYIQDVFVRPGLRGRGVGAQLVRRLALRLRVDGLGWVGLIAADGAWPFYAKLGFRKMKRHDSMRFGSN
ncbi:MAG: GNAT family N-acetyltransferase [Elusimicrobia bacterium]|nr:GNAT family N-acetyltransferase [Elusimicrobiota bacterium]